jgi:KUP system potassium uptake protein
MADSSESSSLAGAGASRQKSLPLVVLGALGIVFGDIGTSPLYAVRQVFHDNPPLAGDAAVVTGIISLILWAVILAVCVKYTLFVMRADNDGEGGTLAMLGLIERNAPPKPIGPPCCTATA